MSVPIFESQQGFESKRVSDIPTKSDPITPHFTPLLKPFYIKKIFSDAEWEIELKSKRESPQVSQLLKKEKGSLWMTYRRKFQNGLAKCEKKPLVCQVILKKIKYNHEYHLFLDINFILFKNEAETLSLCTELETKFSILTICNYQSEGGGFISILIPFLNLHREDRIIPILQELEEKASLTNQLRLYIELFSLHKNLTPRENNFYSQAASKPNEAYAHALSLISDDDEASYTNDFFITLSEQVKSRSSFFLKKIPLDNIYYEKAQYLLGMEKFNPTYQCTDKDRAQLQRTILHLMSSTNQGKREALHILNTIANNDHFSDGLDKILNIQLSKSNLVNVNHEQYRSIQIQKPIENFVKLQLIENILFAAEALHQLKTNFSTENDSKQLKRNYPTENDSKQTSEELNLKILFDQPILNASYPYLKELLKTTPEGELRAKCLFLLTTLYKMKFGKPEEILKTLSAYDYRAHVPPVTSPVKAPVNTTSTLSDKPPSPNLKEQPLQPLKDQPILTSFKSQTDSDKPQQKESSPQISSFKNEI